MSNLEFWNKYKEVPQNALKEFNNGNFKGTDINTIWRMKCLTEEFGMCGIGWYYDIIKIWNEELKEGAEVLTFAEIKLYIKINNEWSKGISGVGGNKMLSYVRSQDYFKANDEATKMAVTDAIGNACRNLGIGADVYWDNDKTKYTNNEISSKTATQTSKTTTSTNYTSKPQTSLETTKNEAKQDISLDTALNTTLNFGKYKGKPLQMVDTDYLHWLVDNSTNDFIRKCAALVIAWENDKIEEIVVEPQRPSDEDNGLPF